MALFAGDTEHLGLGDLVLRVLLGLLHHALDVALGGLDIVLLCADELLRAGKFHRQLGADLVEQIERLVAVQNALVARQRRVLRAVDHLVKHIQKMLHIIVRHGLLSILSQAPPRAAAYIFQGLVRI